MWRRHGRKYEAAVAAVTWLEPPEYKDLLDLKKNYYPGDTNDEKYNYDLKKAKENLAAAQSALEYQERQ